MSEQKDNIRQFPIEALNRALSDMKALNVYHQGAPRRPRQRNGGLTKIGRVAGNLAQSPEAFIESGKRSEIEEKLRQREAEREARKIRPVIEFISPNQENRICPACHMPCNDIDTHGQMRTPRGEKVNCPVCTLPVELAQKRQMSSEYIGSLVKAGKLFSLTNLPRKSAELTLDDFPGDPKAKQEVLSFIDGSVENMLFIGGVGRGKSGLAIAAAQVLIERGEQVLFLSMKRYLVLLQENFNQQENNHIKDIAEQVEILIIDDMGMERVTDTGYAVGEISELIEQRLTAGLKTLITTNFSIDGLEKYYTMKSYDGMDIQPGERVISRLDGYYRKVVFSGEDLRRAR